MPVRSSITRRAMEKLTARHEGARFVFFDLETTGLSPRGCRIIEIAALKVGDGAAVRGEFQALIRIDQKLPRFITRLTGITDGMLEDGDAIEDALPRFTAFTGNLPLVAYNVNFDMGFLRAEAQRLKMQVKNLPLCALAIARRRLPGLPNYKLKTVARYLGVDHDQTHRALDDCHMGLQVYSELMRRSAAA